MQATTITLRAEDYEVTVEYETEEGEKKEATVPVDGTAVALISDIS